MDQPPICSLTEILSHSAHLKKLALQANYLNELKQSLIQIFHSSLFSDCRVCSFKDGLLTLLVPSPAIAHRFRYLEPEMIATLQRQKIWKNLKSLKILVSAHTHEQPSLIASITPQLSLQTTQLLQQTAQMITMPALKQALLKLSSHRRI